MGWYRCAPRLRGGVGISVAAFVTALLALGATRDVSAQSLDVGVVHSAGSPGAIYTLRSAAPLAHLDWHAGLQLDFARDLVLMEAGDGTPMRPLAHRLRAELAVALGLWDRVEVGVQMPFYLPQTRRSYPTVGSDGDTAGWGDLRAVVHGVVLGGGDTGPSLAIAAALTAPTGREDERMGGHALTFTPTVVADWRFEGGALVTVNVGFSFRGVTRWAGAVFGDELRFGVGGELPLGWGGLSLLAELDGALGLGDAVDGDGNVDSGDVPLEALGGLRWRCGGFTVTAGAGGGLTDGYGAPDVRVFAGVGWTPSATGSCGFGDDSGAATTTGTTTTGPAARPRTVQELSDAERLARALAADPDPDGDGWASDVDRCPREPEDRDGFRDTDGCPDPDNDRDGVPDEADRCPNEPETVNGLDDDDGCPDEGEGAVSWADAAELKIASEIHFETGSEVLTKRSEAILREVAAFLKAKWMIRKVLIEGHTDDVGDPEMNVALSEDRANAVRRFLIAEGVAEWRLRARGFGGTRPIVPNESATAKAKNRRVVFTVEETTQPGGER